MNWKIARVPLIVNLICFLILEGGFQYSIVRAQACPSVASFTASRTSISAGQSVTLTWKVVGTPHHVNIAGYGEDVGMAGAVSVTPNKTTSYSLVVLGPGECRKSQKVLVTVK